MNSIIGFVCGGLIVGLFPSKGIAAGGSSAKPSGPSRMQQAIEHFNKGLKHRDKAWDYEKRAAESSKPKKREKLLKKARKEYEKAIKQQLLATTKRPAFHEAFSSLGYAYRKTGKYTPALEAYDRSLALDPTYAEAIQYRAVAHLGLGRFVEAKNAYEQLFVRDPKLAAELLGEMATWRAGQTESDAADELEKLSRWIVRKQTISRDLGSHDGGTADW